MILVSHRGPFRFIPGPGGTYEAHRGAGGVVSALGPLLAAGTDRAAWVAAALSEDDAAGARAVGPTLGLDLRLIELDEQLHHLHYDIVSNRFLWFLHHGMFDRVHQPVFDIEFRDAWDAYVEVNRTFAAAAADAAPPGDAVLVQDYQLTLVPELLRALRPDLRVLHFTHTPFADVESMRMLPTDVAERICASLATGPAGFHCTRWAEAYRTSARTLIAATPTDLRGVFVAPLGIDVGALQQVAESSDARRAATEIGELVGDRRVIVRADRIEPSKNIVRGFTAFDRLLEARPGLRGRVVFLAMLYPSRQSLPEYVAYAQDVRAAVDRVNERWATRDWRPVVLDDRDDFAASIAALQRYDVLLVNPIRDGLNLVAKEGPVLNRRDGVVCLSREAGAFDEMADVVVEVHPYDVEQMAGALDEALAMPFDARAELAGRAREVASARTTASWFDRLIHALG